MAAVATVLIDNAIGEVAMAVVFLLVVTGVDRVVVSMEAVMPLVVITGVDGVAVSMRGVLFLVLEMILTLDLLLVFGLVLGVVSVFVMSVLVLS
jgi:hypothetical protein